MQFIWQHFWPDGHIRSVKQRSLVKKQLVNPGFGQLGVPPQGWHGGGVVGWGHPIGHCGLWKRQKNRQSFKII